MVLLAAAVPGIIAIQRNLEQRSLNDYARTIFVEAQNQLTSRSIAGGMGTVEAVADKSTDFHWLLSRDDVHTLLEGDAVEILETDCFCMLKYNPDTATVLEVFYALDEMDVSAVMDGSFSGADKTAARKEAKIGYFSGEDAEAGKIVKLPAPRISIDNGEELKVKVTLPGTGAEPVACRLTVTVQELDRGGKVVAGRSFELTPTGGEAVSLSQEQSREFVLDSLADGKDFKTLSGGAVSPGANVAVTARLSIAPDSGSKLSYLSSSASEKTNSLFASASNGTARLSNGRHLQNLNYGSSGVLNISGAIQTSSINWADTQEYYAANYGGEFGSSVANVRFYPISNTSLKAFNGQNNEILFLYVYPTAAGSTGLSAGLFASMSDGELRNIRLCAVRVFNYSVSDSAQYATGALAGVLSNTNVTNCSAYSEGSCVYGNSGYVGGLIGSTTGGTVKNSFAALAYVKTEYARTVGGLIGYANGVTVEGCYANAGLLQKNSSTNWQHDEGGGNGDGTGLSSDGKHASGKQDGNVGGIIGTGVSGTTLTLSYSCGYVHAAGTACGLFGPETDNSCRADNCYSVLSYRKQVDAYGLTARDNSICGNCRFWARGNIDHGTGLSAAALLGWASEDWASQGVTYPYNVGTISAPYPYPMIKDLPHYGDWPSPEQIETSTRVFFKTLGAENYGAYSADHVSVEQIPGNDGKLYNQKLLSAYATGAGNVSAVVWQVLTDGKSNWQAVTESSVNVSQGGTVRATVRRNAADNFMTDSGGTHSTGGSVTVTGLNTNNFSEVYVTLRTRSVLSTDEAEWKTVRVRVAPQLAIDPAVAAETSNFIFGSKSVSFSANRTDNEYGWQYQWGDSGTAVGGNSDNYSKTITRWMTGTFNITLKWGPYNSTATLIVRSGAAGDIVSACTNDGGEAENYYFIIEKDTSRQLLYSWSGLRALGTIMVWEDSLPQSHVSMVRTSPTTPISSEGTVVNDKGSLIYTVTGTDYTDASPVTASWRSSQSGVNYSSSSAVCSIHVVGLEASTEATKQTEAGNGPVEFGARAHFPGTDVVSGERSFTWTMDDNEYFTLGTPVNDMTANTSTVTTVPLKANVSGENISENVYCTYSVAGTTFSYTEVFTVVIPSMTEPAIVPCIVDDISLMSAFSPAPDAASWLSASTIETSWRIIEGRTIYLKIQQPVNAAHNVSISTESSDITVQHIKNSDGMTYLRISAAAGTAGSTAQAELKVGYWSGTLDFALVAQPTVSVSACSLEEVNAAFGLTLTELAWPTAKTDNCWQCDSGGAIYLKLTGTPNMQNYTISGVDSAYMSVTPVGGDTVYIRIDTVWPDSDAGTSKDIALSIGIPDAASDTETIRINKAAPAPAPVPEPQQAPANVPSAPPAVEPSTEPPAEPSTEPPAE